jgi:hypothetical protein
MRLTFVSCILSLALVSTVSSGQQQAQPSTHQSPQPGAAKDSAPPNAQAKVAQSHKTHHRTARKWHSKSARGAKRPAYRPEYTQSSVEVINGASTKRVVFQPDRNASVSGARKDEPAPLKVEVVNGNSTDTQYFYAGDGHAPLVATQKRPVVIGIQSADTHVAGGNKHPVVTGVTTSEPGDAKSTTGGGQKVATGISPQPKRPEYQPDAH